MISKYEIFCKVVEIGSFTRVAEELGYSQSAVSQTIKTLEQELGTILVNRKKDGITLTEDGRQYLVYIQNIMHAESALEKKHQEMMGLEQSVIRIGTFTSVSRNLLPQYMKEFKEQYPKVHFVLSQGEYTSIQQWIQNSTVDFGFINADAVDGIEIAPLYQDVMMAVLPMKHPLAQYKQLSLRQLGKEPIILLDEGTYSLPVEAFHAIGMEPDIEYKVYDDYSILAMVRQGLGVSMMYQKVLEGFEEGLVIRPIKEPVVRNVALGWKNWDSMSYAARSFARFIQKKFE